MAGVFLAGFIFGLTLWLPAVALSQDARAFISPPGASPFPASLQAKLTAELRQRGPTYIPRTQNLEEDGSPTYSNRLLLEASPYLLQHAHNPVDWHPWGDEAFEKALKRGVPVFVSIGYSTCHWCHVMEEESFDDPELAEFLNAHFVAVKVDREARPDIDEVYLSAVEAMGINGGWPLNVWVTPARVPFYGGTYFPPQSQRGRPSFRQTLARISEQYAKDPKRFPAHAEAVAKELSLRLAGDVGQTSSPPTLASLENAARSYSERFDDDWGGLRGRIKFPSSLPIPLLLRWHARSDDTRSLDMVTKTLEAMAAGGIRDHLGGGFHRYSTDEHWVVPHFEKMLYDQALITLAYTEAWQETGSPVFADVIRSTLDYVIRELQAPGGAFYSATDADSAGPAGEMEEGLFFTWTPSEIDAVVGSKLGPQVRAWYGVDAAGDVDGRSVLRTWRDLGELSREFEISPTDLAKNLEEARGQLLEARALRPAPLRDEKIIVEWNGLMISALARAGFALGQPRYLSAAKEGADFILENMRSGDRLQRVSLNGKSVGPAFLGDYAFLIAGLLDLYEASSETRWLDAALALQASLDAHYADPIGGYFRNADDSEIVLVRSKPIRDDAIPAGNAVEALNLLRLGALTDRPDLRSRGLQVLSAEGETIRKIPSRVPGLLVALDFALDTPKEVFLVKGEEDNPEVLIEVLRETFVANRVMAIVSDGKEREGHEERIPLLRYKTALNGATTAYVCQDKVCKQPTSDPALLKEQLQRRAQKPRDGKPADP